MIHRLPSWLKQFRLYARLARRHASRRPLESLLLVVGIAIGVAMIVAIDLANISADRAFQLGTDAITGRTTHFVAGGPNGIDESTYTKIRREAGYRLSAPVVEDYVTVTEFDGQPVRLLGIDPLAEAPFRNYFGDGVQSAASSNLLTNLLTQANSVLISQDMATTYGLQPDDRIDARFGSDSFSLEIVGLLAPSDDLSRRALETLIIADIATAQEVLGRVGRLDRIDLIIQGSNAEQTIIARLAEYLGSNEYVATSEARNGAVMEMTKAFRLNLTALSLLALVVGMFLIYNTVTFSVVQRRPVIGSLRALGMTGRDILGLILLEALILGLIGTLLGLGLGIVLGRGAVQLVSNTINDLFFVLSVREVDIPTVTLIKGAVIGVVASLSAAAIPAWEATSIPPTGAMRRSNLEERSRVFQQRISLLAIAMLAIGAVLLIPDNGLVFSFAGLFTVVLGFAFLTPLLTSLLMRGAQAIARSFSGIIGRMAPRYVTRSLSRTSIAVASLMVSVSVIIGVGIMISSFRGSVNSWLSSILQADIYVSAPSLYANQVSTALEPEILQKLNEYPGIASTATSRDVDVPILNGRESTGTVVEDLSTIHVVAISQDLAGEDRNYRSSVGDWRSTWRAVEEGSVIINEPMANRYNLRTGDTLFLLTDRGREPFEIAGVFVDFNVHAVAFMFDPVYRTYWDDNAVSAVALFVAAGADVDETVASLRKSFAGDAELVIRSNRGTRQDALDVFDRTFAITFALQILAMLVAFIGILSTLMSLQLERRREIGILRSNGMTRGQLWRLSLYETGLIGTSAGLIAIPTGLALAAILIYIINLRSFGWSLEMQLAPFEFIRAFIVALLAALLAGLYPAWRMGRIMPATAIRAE